MNTRGQQQFLRDEAGIHTRPNAELWSRARSFWCRSYNWYLSTGGACHPFYHLLLIDRMCYAVFTTKNTQTNLLKMSLYYYTRATRRIKRVLFVLLRSFTTRPVHWKLILCKWGCVWVKFKAEVELALLHVCLSMSFMRLDPRVQNSRRSLDTFMKLLWCK